MTLSCRLRARRVKLNLSRDEVAHGAGIARRTLERWELGETSPTVDLLGTVAVVLAVPLPVLLGSDREWERFVASGQ